MTAPETWLDTLGKLLWKSKHFHKSLTRPFYKRLSKRPAADYPFTADFYGLRYRGNLNNNIDFAVYYFGAFEKPVLYFLRDTLQRLRPAGGGVFLDIGANVGQHSLFMAQYATQVHAFEPYPPVCEILARRAQENALEHIHIHPVGLSDSAARQIFYAPVGRNQGVGSFDEGAVARGNQPVGDLELVNGDAYIAALGLTSVDVVKMDVEGFEKPAIRGLEKMLQQFRPVLVFEVTHGASLSFGSVQEVMDHLPENYVLLTFARRDHKGRRQRSLTTRARVTGEYRLAKISELPAQGQDDLVAMPREKLSVA